MKGQILPKTDVQVRRLNIVDVFTAAVPSHTKITDNFAGVDNFALIKVVVGVIAAHMSIIIISFAVKTPYANAPSAIHVPAKSFNIKPLSTHIIGVPTDPIMS